MRESSTSKKCSGSGVEENFINQVLVWKRASHSPNSKSYRYGFPLPQWPTGGSPGTPIECDAADGVADHGTQTAAVNTAAAATTREVGSMATYSSARVRLLSAQTQTPVVRVAQRASQANVAVPVADAAFSVREYGCWYVGSYN